ncbi:MAG: ABC transporter ATP-binding protein [Proteobacteria bacterium]|nr:ABC transporter ATP-binding protein [Pseudomonadota bacterium]MBU2226307.1 ABC transporter ATP-binding protein [Pseudomonadota bacterium]MBU2261098.1 ABC transporter ATP-binding protein [Pseudomonadota bacterium]
MLELNGVNTYYGNSHVLHDVSLRLEAGETVALLGRNGVGKTTTMRTIMGLTPARRGQIRFKGTDIVRWKPYQVARAGIGFVPEERWIFPSLTVHQNLLIGLKSEADAHTQGPGLWTLERCYEAFPLLKKRQHAKGRTLSGGEQQMLAIARTLVGNPELILIDEPTEGLAPKIVDMVAGIIRDIGRQGMTVLLVEQKLSIVMELAERIYVISKGMIQWHGTPGELRNNEAIRKSYLEV